MRTIEIPRKRAGAIMQALEAQAEALRREARLRGNGGVHLAEHRARLRRKADALECDAQNIRSLLHGQEVYELDWLELSPG